MSTQPAPFDDRVDPPRRAVAQQAPSRTVVPLHPVPLDHRSMQDHVAALRERMSEVVDPGGTDRQHARGKLDARERIDLLLDPGSFTELESQRRHRAAGFGMEQRRPHTDGVITGWGRIDGRRVFVYAHDFRIFGGSLGEAHAKKIHKVMDLATSVGAPLIGLNDGAGARIQEGITALAGYGGIFLRNVRASGVVPQISVILGPCAGGASYSPALTDFVFMVQGTAHMYLTGPDVVKAVTGERVSHEDLGGGRTHATRTGLATFVAPDEVSCLAQVRDLVAMLPANNSEQPPRIAPTDDPDRSCAGLLDLVPTNLRKPYDMRAVIRHIVDDGELTELHAKWARNVICALARLDGHVIGIIGNQPMVKAGVLDIAASEKAARFVRMCDAFNIPLLSLVDVPGFLPGVDQEHRGAIRHGAKLLFAYCEATVPRIQLILRKAYGGAYIVMDSPSIGADLSLAWPTNQIGVMGAEAAVDVIHRRELSSAEDPASRRAELIAEYTDELLHPYYAAEHGLVDEVIDPARTRQAVVRGFEMIRHKTRAQPARKHANQPI